MCDHPGPVFHGDRPCALSILRTEMRPDQSYLKRTGWDRHDLQTSDSPGFLPMAKELIIPGLFEPPVRTLRAIYSGNSEPPYWALLHIFPLYCKYTPLV